MGGYNFYIDNDEGARSIYNTSFLAKLNNKIATFDQLGEYDQKMNDVFSGITKIGNRQVDVSHVYSNFHTSPVMSDLAYFDSMRGEISKMMDIFENGGRVVGFDTETIGSTKSPFITEVGLSVRNYGKGGKLISEETMSYPVLLNAEGRNFLNDAFAAYNTDKDWDALSREQQVALKRASVYANAEKNTAKDASGRFILTSLDEESTNIVKIKQGMEYLTGQHGDSKSITPRNINITIDPAAKAAGPEPDIIRDFANRILGYAEDENTVIYGANTGFDINGIRNALRNSGYSDVASSFSLTMNKRAVDEIAVVRALAEESGNSPAYFLSNVFGIHVSDVSVASQLKALGIPSTQLHMSGPDSANEIEPMIGLKSWITKLLDKDIADKLPKSATKDSAFFFYSGMIEKVDGREFGIIDGKPTRGIGITNQFWVIDPYRSGMTEDGLQRVTFKSLDDVRKGVKKPMMFSIERRPEEIIEFLRNNAAVFGSKDEITDDMLSSALRARREDYGRREFARMFDATAVKTSKSQKPTGFERLKRYMSLEDRLFKGNVPEFTGGNEDVVTFMRKIDRYNKGIEKKAEKEAIKAEAATKGSGEAKRAKVLADRIKMDVYDIQSYLGMRDTLKEEKDILGTIIEKVDRSGGLSNTQKTILAGQAYGSAIEEIERIGGKKVITPYSNIKDAFSMDVMVDGQEIRINSVEGKFKVGSINRALNRLSTGGDPSNLGKGGVRDTRKTRKMISNLVSRYISDDYLIKAEDTGEILDISNEVKKVARQIVNFSEKHPSTDYNYAIAQEIAAKLDPYLDPSKYGRNIAGEISSELHKAYRNAEGVTATAGEIYKGYNVLIDDAINTALNATNIANKVKGNTTIAGQAISMAESLGYGENARAVVASMFGDKGYSLNDTRLRTMVVSPGNGTNGSGWLLVTNEQKFQALQEAVATNKFDFTNSNALFGGTEDIYEYAAPIEFKRINRLNVLTEAQKKSIIPSKIGGEKIFDEWDLGTLKTVSQSGSESEKIIVPELVTYRNREGKLVARMNSAEYSLLQPFQKIGSQFKESVASGDFKDAARKFANEQNAYLARMSASPSYRTQVGADGKITRAMMLNASDLTQAFRMDIQEGMRDIFNYVTEKADIPEQGDFSRASRLLAFIADTADEIGESYDPKTETSRAFIRRIKDTNEFKEKFTKNLWISPDGSSDNTLFSLIRDEVLGNELKQEEYKDIKEAIQKLDVLRPDLVDPVNGESVIKTGINYGIAPHSYNPFAGSMNIMRPQYVANMNAVMLTEENLQARNLTNVHWGRGYAAKMLESQRENIIKSAEEGSTPALRAMTLEQYGKRESDFLALVKNMNDWDLQRKYFGMTENAEEYAKKLGIEQNIYDNALAYFRNEYSSLAEDKTFMSPALRDTEIMSRREAIKVKFGTKDINVEETRKRLESLKGKRVSHDTIVGFKNTKGGDLIPLYFTGTSDVILTDETIKSLLPDHITQENIRDFASQVGSAYALPADFGDVFDPKLVIGGGEKSITHGIATQSFLEHMQRSGFNSMTLEQASDVINKIYSEVFDGAAVVGNFSAIKHGNMLATQSKWLTILNAYQDAGQGQELAKFLNVLRKNSDFMNSNIGEFSVSRNGKLIMDTSKASNLSLFVNTAYERLVNNKGGIADINKNISGTFEEMMNDSTFLAMIERQNINEHMGRALTLDQRQAQGIYMRGANPETGLRDRNNEAIGNFLKQYGSDKSLYLEDSESFGRVSGSSSIDALLSARGEVLNADRINNLRGYGDIRMQARGIGMMNEFYRNVESYKDAADVIDFSIEDLMNPNRVLPSGSTTEELQNSIYFIDGKPSYFLKEKAKGNPKYASAIRINLGTEIEVNGQKTSSILIPRQNVTGSQYESKRFYNQITADTNSFIRRTVSEIKSGNANAAENISRYYKEYIDKETRQLSNMDKKSLITALNEHQLPGSTYTQARDEGSMITKKMLEDEAIISMMEERSSLERQILKGDTEAGRKWTEVTEELQKHIKKEYADKIIDGTFDDKFISTSFSAIDNVATEIIDGKKYAGIVTSMSEQAMEARLGMNFGVIGMQVIAQSEADVGTWANLYGSKHGLNAVKDLGLDQQFIIKNKDRLQKEAVKNLREAGFSINENDIIGSLARSLDDKGISIKDINKDIARGKDGILSKSLKAFRDIGMEYMERVGTIGHYNRSPDFRIYPMVKLALDRNLQGYEARYSSQMLSIISNLDIDGDITAFAAFLSKNGGLLEADPNIGIGAWSKREYRRFLKEESAQAMNEMLLNMAGFNKELLSEGMAETSLLKIATTEKEFSTMYNSMIDTTLKDNKFTVMQDGKRVAVTRQMVEENEGIRHAIESSKAFYKNFHDVINDVGFDFNMATNENMKMSAMAAYIRKDMIGTISTPSFRTRDNLIRTLNYFNEKGEDELAKKVLRIYNDLSNTEGKFGGFLSMAEQVAIDSKKASDALTLSRVGQFMTGLYGLTSPDRKISDEQAVRKILEATGKNVFGIEGAELNSYARMMKDTTYEQFDEIVKALEAGKEVKGFAQDRIELARTMRALKGLSDISKEDIFQLSRILQKNGTPENIREEQQKIAKAIAADENLMRAAAKGTALQETLFMYATPKSSIRRYKEGNIYFQVFGNLSNRETRAFTATDTGFVEITGIGADSRKIKIKGEEVDEIVSGNATIYDPGMSIHEYHTQMDKRLEADEGLRRQTILTDLEKITGDGFITDAEKGALYGRHDYNIDIDGTKAFERKLFGKFSDLRDNIRTSRERYAEYLTVPGILKEDAPRTTDELIRMFNKHIVDNREQYTKTRYVAGLNQYIDSFMRIEANDADNMVKALGNLNVNAFNKDISTIRAMNFIDDGAEQAYKKSIDEIHDNLRKLASVENMEPKGEVEQVKNIFNSLKDRTREADVNAVIGKANELRQQSIDKAADLSTMALGAFDDINYEQQMNIVFNLADANNAKIAFGPLAGMQVRKVSEKDVNLLSEIMDVAYKDADDRTKFAIDKTREIISREYASSADSVLNFDTNRIIRDAIDKNNSMLDDAWIAFRNMSTKTQSDVITKSEKIAAQSIERKTAGQTMKEMTSNIDLGGLLNERTVKAGVVIGGVLMGLNLVSNIMHKHTGSPLEPKTTHQQKLSMDPNTQYDDPTGLMAKQPQTDSRIVNGVMKKNIYIDRGNGLKFKVSAKTKNKIDQVKMAQMVQAQNGGSATINIRKDTSGVTDNWLENKFSEMTV